MRIIFDLDGTLLTGNYEYEEEYFRSILGNNTNMFVSMLPKILDSYENDYSKYDKEMLSSYLALKSGLNDITTEFIDGWLDANMAMSDVMEEGVVETLEYLKSEGHSLVVLTNWFGNLQKARLERANLSEYFDEIYTGDQYIKPHKKAYFNACGRFNIRDCLVIGDTVDKDYIVPRCLGMDAVLYDKSDKHSKELNKVKKLDEIIKKY